jgi:hypothetical protein
MELQYNEQHPGRNQFKLFHRRCPIQQRGNV